MTDLKGKVFICTSEVQITRIVPFPVKNLHFRCDVAAVFWWLPLHCLTGPLHTPHWPGQHSSEQTMEPRCYKICINIAGTVQPCVLLGANFQVPTNKLNLIIY